MVELTQLEFFFGILSIVGILIVFLLGALMIRSYFRNKNRGVLLMGIVIILLSEPWWPYAINLMLFLISGEILPLGMHILIGLGLHPLTVLLGIIVMANLLWENNKKIIIHLSAVYAAIIQIIIFYAAFLDPFSFAKSEGPFDTRYISYIGLILIIDLTILIIVGILFFRETRKSEKPENRLKGTLYIISVLSYVIGAILDSVMPLSLIILLIVRILLVSAAFEIYGAFAMPKWIKKLFLREE